MVQAATLASSFQDFCNVEFGRARLVNKKQLPPASPDLNSCDYYLCPEVSCRVYEGRRTPFNELKQRTIEVLSITF